MKFEQGLEMLKIFKDHVSKSNMLEDFLFYEARQKAMQERKAKLQPIQKQVRPSSLFFADMWNSICIAVIVILARCYCFI